MPGGFWSPQSIAVADGPALTAAAAASCLPVTAKYTFQPSSFIQGSMIRISASGRISCAVTTPGTARFDVRLGVGVVAFDSGPMNLNIVAKTNVPWWLDILMTCRTVGATGNFFGFSRFTSEAVIASGLSTVSGNGSLISSVAAGPPTAPAVGGNVDLTAAAIFDVFFTQTVATGSLTVHQFLMETASINPA